MTPVDVIVTCPEPLGIGAIEPEQSTLTEPCDTSSVLQAFDPTPVALATTAPEQLESLES